MQNTKNLTFSMSVIGALFFVFGFVTWLNSILMPYLELTCNLNKFQASFVPFAFYIAYFVMAIPSSLVLKKTGFSNGMALGLIIMAIHLLSSVSFLCKSSSVDPLDSIILLISSRSVLVFSINSSKVISFE